MGNLYTSTTFMEHNSHPDYKYEMDAPTHEHDGINPSCGDELTLQLRVENGVIEEASFTGHGCMPPRVRQASSAHLTRAGMCEMSWSWAASSRSSRSSSESFSPRIMARKSSAGSVFPNEHERTKSAHPAPRLSFTTRPDANTGVFHSTKGLRQGPGPAK